MSDESTYNGWSNYPTWAVNLWLSNDERLYNIMRESARGILDDIAEDDNVVQGIWSPDEAARFRYADSLREWVRDDLVPNEYDEATFIADLLGYALDQVNWEEIAISWLKNANEQ